MFVRVLRVNEVRRLSAGAPAGISQFEPKLLKNAAVLRQTSLFEIRGSILTYLVCCEITFEHKDFKLGKSITQSVLNGFAPKKLQNLQKIRGYKVNREGITRPSTYLLYHVKRNTAKQKFQNTADTQAMSLKRFHASRLSGRTDPTDKDSPGKRTTLFGGGIRIRKQMFLRKGVIHGEVILKGRFRITRATLASPKRIFTCLACLGHREVKDSRRETKPVIARLPNV
ncbi:hypothetical protein BDZ97DRAFT_1771552 [Flammula alnicola]|nr:hypothetical protein BDZ97DRAFT_1771552 [Flammula alnicola]